MKGKDEFYIGYFNGIGALTRRLLRKYVLVSLLLIIVVAVSFSYLQKPAANGSFDFDSATRISGIYHENPYPMLRVNLDGNEYKDIVLLGFGKFGANPYLDRIREEEGNLVNKYVTIEGNLIYYNGKTLLQIEESNKLEIGSMPGSEVAPPNNLGEFTLEGEIVDSKCYFGVMKPGYGKIHRSCAALCISGGIPPVLVSSEENSIAEYFLLADLKGNPINKDILPYIGQPSRLKGQVSELGDWHLLQIDIDDILVLGKNSEIY